MHTLVQCRARMSAVVLGVLVLFAAPAAHAQEPPAAPPPMAAEPAARPLFGGVHWGVGSSFGADSPVLFLAGNYEAIAFGVGAFYLHDGNIPPPMDETHAGLVLSLGYMVHNVFPFAMGPEADFIGSLAPKAFDDNSLRLGWAFWYAPWNIPCIIGTAAFVNLDFPPGLKSRISTVTPAVRIVFGFH
jgi:hypothetical protein